MINVLYEYQKRFLSVCLICLMCMSVYACGQKQDTMAKIKDLECTVLAEENIPEELLEKIEDKKEEAFKMTFEDQGFLYICVGYGTQKTGGYSIAVDELYLTDTGVIVSTTLLGPEAGAKENGTPSCPYIVIKTEYLEQNVTFE